MTNNRFLLIEMDDHNSFQVLSQVYVHGTTLGGHMKVDTGCAISVIPFQKMKNISRHTSLKYKERAVNAGLRYVRSYGISDTEENRRTDDLLIKEGRIMECTAIKFIHEDVDIALDGYRFRHSLAINYDRTGNALIGMDILKDFRFVCDQSRVTGEMTFIGCLRSQDDQTDFRKALETHFGVLMESF